MSEAERRFQDEFRAITSEWYDYNEAYDGSFPTYIQLDGMFGAKQLRAIADLIEKYGRKV